MRRFGALGIAVVGLLMLSDAIGYLSLPITVLAGGGMQRAAVLSFLPTLAAVAGGVYLIAQRATLAQDWLPEDASGSPASSAALVRAGLILIGVYLFASAVPLLLERVGAPIIQFAQLKSLAEQGGFGASPGQVFGAAIPRIAAALASLGIGWLLVARVDLVMGRIFPEAAEAQRLPQVEAVQARCPACGAAYDPADYDGGMAEPRCGACKTPLPRAE